MNLSNLENIIITFITNTNQSAILINGPWGIGKTYTVFSCLQNYTNRKVNKNPNQNNNRQSNKKYKFGYTSIFGKKSVNELHASLYLSLEPGKNRIWSLMNGTLKTIMLAMSCVGFSWNIKGTNISLNGKEFSFEQQAKKEKQNYKIKEKQKKEQTIVVIDDLERKSNSITDEEVMGYMNNLMLDGIKIIVLSNLPDEKISKLSHYKEKVFDRIYQVNYTQKEILQNILNDNYKFIDKEILDLLENNLRLIRKTNDFYNELLGELDKICKTKNIKYTEYFDKKELFYICSLVVKEVLMSYISNNYSEKRTKAFYELEQGQVELEKNQHVLGNKTKKILNNIKLEKGLENYILNGYPTKRIAALCYKMSTRRSQEDTITDFRLDYNSRLLMESILLLFEEHNTKKLDKLLDELSTPKNENVLSKDIFFYSEKEKQTLAQQQYKAIFSQTDTSNIAQIIRDWWRESHIINLAFIHEEDLFNRLSDLKFTIDSYTEKYFISNGFRQDTKEEYESFLERYKQYQESKNTNLIIEKLKVFTATQEFLDLIYELNKRMKEEQNLHPNSHYFNEQNWIKILNTIKEENFYLSMLPETISYCYWNIIHTLCRFIQNSKDKFDKKENYVEDFYNALKSLHETYPKNKTLMDRVNSLIKQYSLGEVLKDE